MVKRTRRRRRRSRRQRGGNKRAVVFTLTHGAGFGSVFGYMLQAYIYAKKGGYAFRVKNENWQYGPEKGWHDFFTTLEAYNSAEKMKEENFKHATGPRESYTLGEYHEAIKEIYKPNKEILEAAEEFKKKIGGSYKSVFVRRGDKTSGEGKEMDAADLSSLTKEMGIKDGNLFVMSDDYAVVEEIKELLPNVKVFTLTEPEAKGFSIHRIQSASVEVKKKEAAELFTSVEIFHGGEKGWADNRSNLGRFLKMRDLEKVVLYPPEGDIPLNKIVNPSTDYLRA